MSDEKEQCTNGHCASAAQSFIVGEVWVCACCGYVSPTTAEPGYCPRCGKKWGNCL